MQQKLKKKWNKEIEYAVKYNEEAEEYEEAVNIEEVDEGR